VITQVLVQAMAEEARRTELLAEAERARRGLSTAPRRSFREALARLVARMPSRASLPTAPPRQPTYPPSVP
jgi:hypothetical protein